MSRGFPHEFVSPAEDVNMSSRELQRLVRLWRRNQIEGGFPGGQIAVRRHGVLVLNESIGLARGWDDRAGEQRSPVTTTTQFPVFSAGKAVIAVVIAMLEERGKLDINAPIADLFPEFATAPGKEEITPLDVLTHTAGMLMPEFCNAWLDWPDWDKVRAALIAAPPVHKRGKLAYHPLEYGWLLSEVIQRAAGVSLQDFLRTELAEPLGLPALRFGADKSKLESHARSYTTAKKPLEVAGMQFTRIVDALGPDSPLVDAFIPGAGLVCDAATLAGFYEFLVHGGVTRTGQRLISEKQVRLYTKRAIYGWDRTNKVPIALSRGFFVGAWGPSVYGWFGTRDCFGHPGAFSTVAFGDHRTGISAAVVSNANKSPIDLVKRMAPVCHRILRAARKGPGKPRKQAS
jgi:CubicO group peptidase (beta-lactamase class C family)